MELETDIDLAVYKAVCQLPLTIQEIADLVELGTGKLMGAHKLDEYQIITVQNWMRSEEQRYRMQSVSNAHHTPADKELEKIL